MEQPERSPIMPTGIASLDPVVGGGVPAGSVILLLGDIGAGSAEFVYSSILNLSLQGRPPQAGTPPAGIRYITFTKRKEDIVDEIGLSFHADLRAGLDRVRFDDLSEHYFDSSVVPLGWYSRGNIVERIQRRKEHESVLADLANRLTGDGTGLVVLDSLTDIATQYAGSPRWQELVAFLRGLQRISKEWNSTFYVLLTRGILDPSLEREIADTADAVILFRWEESTAARRQRVMYFEKFRGLMPHLEENDLVKFAVRISAGGGFEVSNIRVVI